LSLPQVEVGDELQPDDDVGLSGNTGESTGPHLHFAVLNTSFNFVDPRPFLLSSEGST
jgi:murein DD-endopeptidase MepM/ murein hydrolase activator NlpD